jgi:hypothetical protein
MLTPVEELGLAGQALAGRVRRAVHAIPDPDLRDLLVRIQAEAEARNLIYYRDGEADVIRVLPTPLTVLPDQVSYLHYAVTTLMNALKRLPDLYLQDPAARAALRLPPDEERWLLDFWTPAHREDNPVFGRLDAVVDCVSPMWKDSLKFVEPNLSCVGGISLVPACEGLVADLVVPEITRRDPAIRLELGADTRSLLMQTVLDHLRAIGRRGRTLCFVEFLYEGVGPADQNSLTDYVHDQYGLRVLHADPSELTLRDGEVCVGDELVDLVYRDYEVRDLLEMERDGADVEPLRTLFRENRVISPIAAELDQKSCWEVLTDPDVVRHHFTADERQVFRRHLPWTRVLSDRRTALPDGGVGDLVPFARAHHETLVLKPNRSYGGKGVVVGHLLDRAGWEAEVNRALAGPDRYVVQQLVPIPVHDFPVLGQDGVVHVEPFYTVMGFAATQDGLGVLGRASQKQVVNVAQRGGMVAVMVGHSPGRLAAHGG